MFKLMIVDDDIQIRNGVSTGIKWSDIGITDVAAFGDGIDALAAFETFNPDILITDVKMAQMNGIELLKEVKRLKPQIKVMLISGFSDFEYVQQALQLGANDYELKPTSARILIKKISALKDEILKEQTSISIVDKYKKEYKINTFSNILHGNVSNYFIIKDFFETYYNIKNFYELVMMIIVDDSNTNEDLKMSLTKELQRMYAEEACCVNIGNVHVVIVNVPNSMLIVNLRKNELKNLFLNLLQTYNAQMSAAVSDGASLKEIANVYKTLSNKLTNRFYNGPGVCLTLKEKPNDYDTKYVADIKKKVCNETSAKAEFNKLLDELQTYWKKNHCPSPENIKQTLLDIIYEYAGSEACMEIQNKFGTSLEKCIYLCDIIEYLKTHAHHFISNEIEIKAKNYSVCVKAAINYINEHFNEQITIDLVAQHVEKSPNYLSSLFNKEVGVPYTKYLSMVRVKKAKKLLLNTDIPYTQVAEMVGYNDYTYFVSVFKGVESCTPSAMRKGKGKNGQNSQAENLK